MSESNDADVSVEEPNNEEVMSMFASVWVKVEVSEVEEECDSTPDQLNEKPKKKRAKLKTLQCDQCEYTTIYKNCLRMHMLDHSNSRPFSCPVCKYKTKYPASFTRHLQIQHPTDQKIDLPSYNCEQCDYKTLYKGNLTAHKRKHKSDNIYKCDSCEYTTAYKHNYLKHKKVHGKVEVAYQCDKCPFVTKFEGHISRHLAKIHNEISEKATKCENCDFSTKIKWRMNIHLQRSKQNDIMKCDYCEFESYYMCAVKKHKSIHYYETMAAKVTTHNVHNVTAPIEGTTTQDRSNHFVLDQNYESAWNNIQVIELANCDRPYQCIMCDYASRFKSSVQRHYQRLHTDKSKPYKCVNCDFSTKTRDQISLHNKRSLSDVQLNCSSCEFNTKFKCQLIMHQKCHYEHKCTACDYASKHKYEMQKHYIASHLGKGLQCRFCDFKSPRKESLLSHESTHTGNKPFQCQFCDYKSVRKSILAVHVRRNHSEIDMGPVQISESKIQSLKIPLDENYFKSIDENERQVLNELCSGRVDENLSRAVHSAVSAYCSDIVQSLKVPVVDNNYFRPAADEEEPNQSV